MKKTRKLWYWIFRCIGMLVIIGAVLSLSDVLNGGSVPEIVGHPHHNYHPIKDVSGTEGIIQCLLCIGIGLMILLVTVIKTPKENDKDDSQINACYPNCRWWQDEEGKWYSEENPQMEKIYPEDGICPLCRRKIEKIEIYQQEYTPRLSDEDVRLKNYFS